MKIGTSTSSAEASKKAITVLSEVRRMETCSAATASWRERRVERSSMNSVRGVLGLAW